MTSTYPASNVLIRRNRPAPSAGAHLGTVLASILKPAPEPSWQRADAGHVRGMGQSCVTRIAHVPYALEQDEDGVWCASAQLRPGVGAVGDGPTAEAVIADLRGALEALLAEAGPPEELTLTLDVA